MQITLTSKNQEKTFTDTDIINIGTNSNCDFQLSLPYELLLSLQKSQSGKWVVINNFKSTQVLFRGQPMGAKLEIGALCKLMFLNTNDFVTIKIMAGANNVNPKISRINSMQPEQTPVQPQAANNQDNQNIQNTQNVAPAVRQPQAPSSKTITMIEGEELNEFDIRELYGSGINAQTKIKLDKRKADIERRRTSIIKEVAYKVNDLTQRLSQNEKILSVMNILLVALPFIFMNVLRDGINLSIGEKQISTHLLVIFAIGFVVNTLILKQGSYMRLQNKSNPHPSASSVTIQRLCLLVSGMLFMVVIFVGIALMLGENKTVFVPQMLIFCSVACMLIGTFAGFMKNINTEIAEELDGYEMREDFQAIVKDYQTWISFFVNNTTQKRIRDIKESLFNLKLKSAGEYLLGILTAPFLAYGVSQTLAMCFPDAAGWIRISGLTLSPVFLILATLLIVFAFHSFATSFTITRRVHASNVIKQDGFSDYNIHGVSLHGSESTKNLKKEAKKWFFIALAVVAIEITMNVSYFIGEMGSDMQGMLLSFVAALVPTSILIMETTMLGNTKFEIVIREEMLAKIDKDF